MSALHCFGKGTKLEVFGGDVDIRSICHGDEGLLAQGCLWRVLAAGFVEVCLFGKRPFSAKVFDNLGKKTKRSSEEVGASKIGS